MSSISVFIKSYFKNLICFKQSIDNHLFEAHDIYENGTSLDLDAMQIWTVKKKSVV